MMSRYRDSNSRADRAAALAGVVVVHAAVGLLVLTSRPDLSAPPAHERTILLDIREPPPPPPPPPERPKPKAAAPAEEGATGKKAEPAPIVLPPPKRVLPVTNPLPTATRAGTGSAPSSGAGVTGTGPGSGGSGSGTGSGGTGSGAGTEIGEHARLLSGGLSRRDYRGLRAFAVPSGRAVLALLVGPDGRVFRCSIGQSSGDRALDASLCGLLQPRMRWSPARDLNGRPVSVGIMYTAVWSPD